MTVVPASASGNSNAKAQARDLRKLEKRREKATKKYAKQQKKAEKKMLRTEKKNSFKYPSHPY